MDNFFTRFRAEVVLAAVLFVQVIALATQVRTPSPAGESAPLIRVWAVALISPFQKAAVNTGGYFRGLWHEYVDLRGVRHENEALRDQLDQMRIAQTRMEQDAAQGRRLQSLLEFKEQFIAHTLAAQVIGTSGTDLARVIYVDRGQQDGVQPGMAVITPDGVVGKVLRADKGVSQILLITDPTSGAGVLLERQRLNGILRGSGGAYPEVLNVMGDEKIEVGDRVITTGGDRVFPKGLPVGTVASVALDKERDPFLAIKVKPAVNLAKLEEVLIVTQLPERLPEPVDATSGPVRAADMLAQRLPSVKKKEAPQEAAGDDGEGPPPDTSVNAPPDSTPQKKAPVQKPAAPSKKDGPR